MANSDTMDAIEKTLDVVDETLETIERIPKVNLNGTTKAQQVIILCVTAGVAAAIGGAVTYYFTKKTLRQKYVERSNEEIAAAKAFYAVLHKKDELSDPTTALESYAGKVEGLEYTTIHPALEPIIDDGSDEAAELIIRGQEIAAAVGIPVKKLIENDYHDAEPNDEPFDYEEEMKNRNPSAPYVITIDEYMLGDKDYVQTSLTYFAGDDVLIDDKDEVINDADPVVGEENLKRFGHGSRDNNIVYIRNEILEGDFEVVLNKNKYTQEVLGFIEHEHRPGSGKTPKFRRDDG